MANEGNVVYAIVEFSCGGRRVKNHIYVAPIAVTAMSVVKEANHEPRWRITGSQGGHPCEATRKLNLKGRQEAPGPGRAGCCQEADGRPVRLGRGRMMSGEAGEVDRRGALSCGAW